MDDGLLRSTEGQISSRTRVLIVEDLPSDAELCSQEIISALGPCEFRVVETRDEYIAELDGFCPMLIISDFKLPHFDGLTALKLAKERAPDVPFIILTGSMNEDTAVECMRAGAWDYVIKEHITRLGLAVEAVLKQGRERIEKKCIERALEVSEKRYRRLFEAAKDGILILDADTGRIVDVNPFLTELIGYSREEFLSRFLWEIGPFKDIAASKISLTELQLNRYVRYENLPLETRDGRRIDVEFVCNVYQVGGQDVIQCNIRDITEKKREQARIIERHATLNAVLESTEYPIFSLDREYRYTAFNRAHALVMKALYGTDIQLGGNIAQYQTVAEDWQIAKKNIDRALQGEAVLENAMSGAEGTTRRYFEVAHHPIRVATGEVIGVSVFVRDLTERKRAEEEREALKAQLLTAQKMEAIGRLAGGIAHDFNNLLSVIMAYTDFATGKIIRGVPIADELTEVMKAAERGAVLTRQLLAFSRKQVLQPVSMNLNQITEGVDKMLRRVLGEDIDLVCVLAPDLGLTLADPGQMEQVLMNLVVNARDAMAAGGKITIETANEEINKENVARYLGLDRGSYVRLTVADTGCGMDEQTKALIFDPFFTTKEKGKGTGLGLSTVHGIVEQSGGRIWVDSEPGKGTTFSIYLPREIIATSTARSRKPSFFPRPLTGSETILIVEDEESLCKIFKRALEQAGYTVLTAEDGEEALLTSAKYTKDIHLLLSDVVMPRMSGRALTQELMKARPTLNVIYMSGYTDEAIAHHGVLDAGIHFLAKPFTVVDLARKVREVLDNGVGGLADRDQRAC